MSEKNMKLWVITASHLTEPVYVALHHTEGDAWRAYLRAFINHKSRLEASGWYCVEGNVSWHDGSAIRQYGGLMI